jgi:YesN/AraC family two-component response regulator
MSYVDPQTKATKNISIHENEFVLIRPNVSHFQWINNDTHMMVLELRHIDQSIPVHTFLSKTEFVDSIPSACNFFKNLDCVTLIVDTNNIQNNLKMLLKILHDKEHNIENLYFNSDYELHLKQMILDICKCRFSNTKKAYNRYIQYVLTIIENNYNKPIIINELAENLSISPIYLNKIFKKEIGTNIQDYLISVRIENAIKLLKEKNYTISAIAKQVGYQNLRSFDSAFIKKIGVSPTEYQKKLSPDAFVLWKRSDQSIAEDISSTK